MGCSGQNKRQKSGRFRLPNIAYLFLLWLLSLPAVMPLFQPTLTRSADGLLHLYRLVALDEAVRQAVFFPRWFPDLAYGYGLPLFVFYAPLSYYLTELLNLLGLGAVGSLNASFALALLLSGSGMYLFTKDIDGPKAGILAAVAYVYAPVQLFNLLSRGSLPAVWAGAVFPFAFWAFGRLIQNRGSTGYLALSAVISAIAILMHNISSLIFFPLLLLYLAVRLWSHPLKLLLKTSAALALGVGLTAFFWLPAMVEKKYIQIERVITPPDFDYHSNFISLSGLFSLPPAANTGLLNPDFPFTLGLTQVGLAAVGMAIILGGYYWKMDKPSTSYIPLALFATTGLGVTIFMMLPVSVGVWDRLPLIAFVQQPHRLMVVASFLLALLTGLAVAALPERLGYGLTLGGLGLIFITSVPLLYPHYYTPLPTAPTMAGMMAYEQESGAIGTTSFGEYLPIWVKQTPRESPLMPLYQANQTIERLDRAYLPPEAVVKMADYGFNRLELVIDSPKPYQAIFHIFYFPGWQAEIDGQPATVAPVTERGLIGLTVPVGQHKISLSFTETPIRLAANWLSVLALLMLAGTVYYSFPVPAYVSQPRSTIRTGQFTILVGLALLLITAKIFYLDRYDNPLKQSFKGGKVAGIDVVRAVNFGHQLNLLGYDLSTQTVTAGGTVDFTLYWQTRQPIAINYSVLTQLVDEKRNIYAGQDNLHPGGLPVSRWKPWGFVQDPHTIHVPPGTPPGTYFLTSGLYDPATWVRLLVIEGGDSGWADVVAVPVIIAKPNSPPNIEELDIVWSVEAEFGALRLLGATPERNILRNDFLRVAIFWEATKTPTVDYQINLRLIADDGTIMLEKTGQPSHNRYPTTKWESGERVRDNHAFWIPTDFPAGNYHLQVRVLDEAGRAVGDWVELGMLAVNA